MMILTFGNPALAIDNLAVKVGEALSEDHEVQHLENPLDLLDHDLSQAVIIDVAQGVEEVTLIDDLDKLSLGRLCSLHDFDMAFFMKLLKRIGEADAVRIIALPQDMALDTALEATRRLL